MWRPVIAAASAAALLLAGVALSPWDNVAQRFGLTHSFANGGDKTKRFIIETTGSGVALLDLDNDHLPEAFVLSGEGGTSRLYRNQGGVKFADSTRGSGIEHSGWEQGVCAGDYDNDGKVDLLVTHWGGLKLYRNLGRLRFRAVTGLQQARRRYNTGCAFLDYDQDGDLDLFVANYLVFDPATTPTPGSNPYCFYRGLPVNCGPRGLPFDRNLLYRNDGGRFSDVSESSGIASPLGHYSLGVLTGDFNEDGWPDIYVAADQTPSLLYINDKKGKFTEEAVLRGAAFDENGKALSGMGAAAGDYDNNGTQDIFRTNFSDERETLYRNRGRGEFDDRTLAAGLALNTRFVGWGCAFLDIDNDGWRDLFLVNGHVFPELDSLKLDIRYKDRAILYRNTRDGKFEDSSERAGPGWQEKHSARGAAIGDFDNDGTLEVLINNQNEPPALLRQRTRAPGHWLTVRLTGTRSNRSAIGAQVRVKAGALVQSAEVRSGGSYLSQSDLTLHFGLGENTTVEFLEVLWPAGGRQRLEAVKADAALDVREP